MKHIFEDIIKNRRWSQTLCGSGSTFEYTQNLRSRLVPTLKKLDINSMLDAPCGDYSWMSTVEFPKNFKYIGGDIVNFMIEDNKRKFPKTDFLSIDITQDELPEVDLLFCRDCLLHLSNNNIKSFFNNLKNQKIKFLAMSNWYDKHDNYKDINVGENRYINFLEEPYNFPQPIEHIEDFITGFPRREILFWSYSDIEDKL